MQMDRLLAPTRPFNTILRPGDGKVPERIAYVLCTGSRDETVGNPLCSRFCCMYSIKQNQLLMGALPLADVTVHYMDIRAPGKRYDEFYEQAKAMGANYVKGRVAKITEKAERQPRPPLRGHRARRQLVEAEYDLVVLAVGVQPNRDAEALFPEGGLSLDEFDVRRRAGRGPRTRARRASPASSSPAPRRAPRTSPTRSSTPGRPSPRWRPTSRRRKAVPA